MEKAIIALRYSLIITCNNHWNEIEQQTGKQIERHGDPHCGHIADFNTKKQSRDNCK